MAVNCAILCETEEKKYHHNITIAAVFDGIYSCVYFVAKTSQAGAKGARALPLWNLKKANLVINVSCHTT